MQRAVVLVSGWSGPGLEWRASPIRNRLRLLGHKVVYFRQCNNGWGEIGHNARKFARLALSLHEMGYEVSAVGHSMGGLVIREGELYAPVLSAYATLGTPHHGTPLPARYVFFSESARQMARGSDYLRELNTRAPVARVLAVAGRFDAIVPPALARWERATETATVGHTHMTLVTSGGVARRVSDFFAAA